MVDKDVPRVIGLCELILAKLQQDNQNYCYELDMRSLPPTATFRRSESSVESIDEDLRVVIV